jgi:hypothetical protein
LVISSSVKEVINVFLLRFDENGLFLDQVLWIFVLKERAEITVSVFISLLEWDITIFIFLVVDIVLLIGKP